MTSNIDSFVSGCWTKATDSGFVGRSICAMGFLRVGSREEDGAGSW